MRDNNLFDENEKKEVEKDYNEIENSEKKEVEKNEPENLVNENTKENNKEEKEIQNKNEELEKEKKEAEEIHRRKEELRNRLNKEQQENNIEKRERKLGGKFNFKGLIMLLFIITLVLSFPTFIKNNEKKEVKNITYTEFFDKVKNKEIEKIEEKESLIYGYTKDEATAYKTRMITSRLGNDTNLVTAIEENGGTINSVPPQEVPFYISILASWFPTLLLIGVFFFMMNKMGKGNGGGPQIFNMGKSKTKENGEETSKVTFEDVAGVAEAKVELEEVVKFLKEPEKFRAIGAKIPKGVLLLGEPGTGKTLLAKAVAGEAKVPFFSMSGSEFVEMFVGVGASRVRDLFSKARKNSPCIVFIDEIDAVGRKRGTGQGGGNDEREQTLNQLLVEMDGFGNEETIIVLAATNRAEILDRALTRPGRFDRQVYVELPDREGREAILKIHAKNKKLAKDVDLKTIAKKTTGFAGADLANVLNEAAILAVRDNRDEINRDDIEEAVEKVLMGPEKKNKKIAEKERKITAYHEAGHGVMHYLLPDTAPVHKITIVPRGRAGGYTMSLDEEEKMYKTKSGYISELKTLYGGRAAEEIVFGAENITTGASNDIERATAIARAMVTRFGMTEKFGPILLDNTQPDDYYQRKYYSDISGKEIDEEIRKIVNENYQLTVQLLRDNFDKLDAVAKVLLERETIYREEFERIMLGEENSTLQNEENVL